jgi:branched-chain amino acid transport system ATP-binding protein
VEQNAFLALQLADRAYVLSDGGVFDCTASELAGDTTRMGRIAGVSHTA